MEWLKFQYSDNCVLFQEQGYRLRNSMSSLRHTVGDKLGAMGDKLEAMEEKSKDLIHGFVGLFGRDGRIVSKRMI